MRTTWYNIMQLTQPHIFVIFNSLFYKRKSWDLCILAVCKILFFTHQHHPHTESSLWISKSYGASYVIKTQFYIVHQQQTIKTSHGEGAKGFFCCKATYERFCELPQVRLYLIGYAGSSWRNLQMYFRQMGLVACYRLSKKAKLIIGNFQVQS